MIEREISRSAVFMSVVLSSLFGLMSSPAFAQSKAFDLKCNGYDALLGRYVVDLAYISTEFAGSALVNSVPYVMESSAILNNDTPSFQFYEYTLQLKDLQSGEVVYTITFNTADYIATFGTPVGTPLTKAISPVLLNCQ